MNAQKIALLYISQRDFTRAKAHELGLNDTECNICNYVYLHDSCSQDTVAKALKVDKTTITKAVNSLEKKGMITRHTDPDDRRRNMLAITPGGKRKNEEIIKFHDAWLANAMSSLTVSEQKEFEKIVDKLLAAIGYSKG